VRQATAGDLDVVAELVPLAGVALEVRNWSRRSPPAPPAWPCVLGLAPAGTASPPPGDRPQDHHTVSETYGQMADDYRDLFAEQGQRWQAETTLTTTSLAAVDAYVKLVAEHLANGHRESQGPRSIVRISVPWFAPHAHRGYPHRWLGYTST
jgi:hypothetical protein